MKKHFEELNQVVMEKQVCMTEVQISMAKIKNSKAAGKDEVAGEVIKSGNKLTYWV